MQVEKDLYQGRGDDSSYVFGSTRDYGLSMAGPSRDHHRLSTDFHSSYGLCRMPISLNPISYDTHHSQTLDVIEENIPESSSLSLDDMYTGNCAHDVDSPINLQPDVGPFALGPPQPLMESRPNLPVQNRKSRTNSSPKKAQNVKLIDGEVVLWLLFKYIPKPTMEDIENIAKDTDYSFDFVIDSYCQYRKSDGMDGTTSKQAAAIGRPMRQSREPGTRKTSDGTDSTYGTQVNESTMDKAQPPSKRARVEGGSFIQAMQSIAGNTQNKPHECSQCSQTFRRQSDLKRHLKTHAPGEFHCPYNGCGKAFSRRDKLNDHWRRCHEDNAFRVMASSNPRDDSDNDPNSGDPSGPNNFFPPGGPLQSSQNSANSTSPAQSNYSPSFNDGYTFLSGMRSTSLHAKTQEKLSEWRVIRKLGHGGFGSVYEMSISHGAGSNDHDTVASKIVHLPKDRRKELMQRALNEISILQLLDHSHIVKLAGAYAGADRVIINTFPVADCNLTQFMSSQSLPISIFDKRNILEQLGKIASAIAYIHDYRTDAVSAAHCDLKPDNILVRHDTESKWLLCDFGCARISESYQLNLENPAMTPRYCAPEFPNREIGQKADIWSFGCILAEVFTLLHDRTMQDFETFASKSMVSKRSWNYSDILPVLIDWLESLSNTCAHLACPLLREEHINLVMEMLRLNPSERPCAASVVRRLRLTNNLNTKELIIDPVESIKYDPDQKLTLDANSDTGLRDSSVLGSLCRIKTAVGCPEERFKSVSNSDVDGQQKDHGLLPLYEPLSNMRTYKQALDTEIIPELDDFMLGIKSQKKPTMDPDHKLLSFNQHKARYAILDQYGKPKVFEITARIHGMFFLSEITMIPKETSVRQPVLTCYRRNLLQISGTIASPTGPISVVTKQGRTVPIVSQELSIVATESLSNNIIKLMVIPWKVPLPNLPEVPLSQAQGPLSILIDSNADGCQIVTWRRLQFAVATANNGRRMELQQYFVVRLNLTATLADGTKLCIAEAATTPIVVRGRSPRNFLAREEMRLIGSSAPPRRQPTQDSPTDKIQIQKWQHVDLPKQLSQYISSDIPHLDRNDVSASRHCHAISGSNATESRSPAAQVA